MRLRECVRALICDPGFHVLLVNFDWAGLNLQGGVWATPGGGVEPGETRLEALQREMVEEIGLEVDSLGPEIWTRTNTVQLERKDAVGRRLVGVRPVGVVGALDVPLDVLAFDDAGR